jgi:hypothetical protein
MLFIGIEMYIPESKIDLIISFCRPAKKLNVAAKIIVQELMDRLECVILLRSGMERRFL